MANLALDPMRHGNGKSSLQLCLDVALKNIVGLGLDSHLSAPGRDSEKEMSFVLSPESWRRAAAPTVGHKHLCVSWATTGAKADLH